ncbi:MAG: Uma2 family endonuclease [Leptospiraceae bacterium]|nr:Uma2 family endonuclease [Leptospiraceae bacterium]MCP5493173.1 Uma2 family endonuclease [Leptospiraceae bacterium]
MLLETIEIENTMEEEMPSLNHSYLTKKLTILIDNMEKWEAWPELSLDLNGFQGYPDISVYPKGELKPNFFKDTISCKKPPFLAIEITSPTQGLQKLMEKAELLVLAGIKSVWIVEPFTKSILVVGKEGIQRYQETIVTVKDISIDFAEVLKD